MNWPERKAPFHVKPEEIRRGIRLEDVKAEQRESRRMDKVYCKTRRVIIEHSKGGPLLDVEYVPDASYTWEQVTAFFKRGKFALKFEGPIRE